MYSMLDWVVQIGVDADVKVNRLSVVMRNVYIVVVVVKGGRKVDGVGGQVIDSGGQFLDFLFFF